MGNLIEDIKRECDNFKRTRVNEGPYSTNFSKIRKYLGLSDEPVYLTCDMLLPLGTGRCAAIAKSGIYSREMKTFAVKVSYKELANATSSYIKKDGIYISINGKEKPLAYIRTSFFSLDDEKDLKDLFDKIINIARLNY